MREGERHSRARLVDGLAAVIKGSGWTVEQKPAGGGDLLIEKDVHRYVIEVKALNERPRRSHMRAFMAAAVLEARATAHGQNARPFAVVAAPRVSDAMLEELAEYVREVAQDVAWGAMDGRGRVDLHGPGLDEIHRPPARGRRGAPIGKKGDPFSDLGQWMLKVLMAPGVPPEFLSSPRAPLRGVSDLARVGGVSVASASRQLSALDSLGHLLHREDGIQLARLPQLLDHWRAAVRGPQHEQRCEFHLPVEDPLARLEEILRRRGAGDLPRACLGLFAACRKLGIGWVKGAPLHLLLEDISPSILSSEFGLRPAGQAPQTLIVVRRPRFPETVFRASVEVDGIRVSDAVQCWLDVSSHPSRGKEQAAEIEERLPILRSERGS